MADTQKNEVPKEVQRSMFGCNNCLWLSCECVKGSKYIPAEPFMGKETCETYTYFD